MEKPKRTKREKPNKNWTEADIQKILNYLQAAPEIEAPTAQIFYKKLVQSCEMDVTWDLVRWKVRHLKEGFKRANDWRKSTGAGLLENDLGTGSVEEKVLQMCPHYKQMSEIFGRKGGNFEVVDSGDMEIVNELGRNEFTDNIQIMDENECYSPVISPPRAAIDTNNIQTPVPSVSVPTRAKEFAEKMKKSAPKSSAVHLAAFQAERTEMCKLKLSWEREKHTKDLVLEEKKIRLEEENIELQKRELEYKLLQLEEEERLRVLQLEKVERIAKYEMNLKYKYSVEN